MASNTMLVYLSSMNLLLGKLEAREKSNVAWSLLISSFPYCEQKQKAAM